MRALNVYYNPLMHSRLRWELKVGRDVSATHYAAIYGVAYGSPASEQAPRRLPGGPCIADRRHGDLTAATASGLRVGLSRCD